MERTRKILLKVVLALFALWVIFHFSRIADGGTGLIQLVLGMVFSIAILLRIKSTDGTLPARPVVLVGSAFAGIILAVGGLVFNVGQFEWLGILCLLYAFLRWGFPPRYGRDVLMALFVLYWIHPLPGRVFGPLQLAMQWLSVQGAEWFLQAFNARVWADNFILHTALRDFGVPEACSGMKTAVTVLYCTLGIGLLFRFSLVAVVLFMAAGLAQVLLLNILRISFLVLWSVRMPVEWGESFLHDSLGIFLLVAVLLVQLEASWWQIRRTRRHDRENGIASGRREGPDVATTLPRFWYLFFKWFRPVLLVVVLVAFCVFMVVKRRPYHRAMLISDVVVGLAERDLDTAARAVAAGMRFMPASRDFKVKQVQIMLMKGRHAQALTEIDGLPLPLDPSEKVMKSRALMMLGRSEEAVDLVRSLPEELRKQPMVAMIMAEYGALRNDPGMVKENIVTASLSHLLNDRVRALYPFLQHHEQWQTIADTDNFRVPYNRSVTAAIAIRARIKLGQLARAARLLEQALEKWPGDPQFMGSLFAMAAQDPGGKWEQRFAEHFMANVAKLSADNLATYLLQSFRIGRPDLGWLAWRNLKAKDATDPALSFIPARFGSTWMTFRRRLLGLSATDPDAVIDLKPFRLQTAGIRPFSEFWKAVPFAEELGAQDAATFSKRLLDNCLAEFRHRSDKGTLTQRMEMNLPAVLAMAGNYDEAHRTLAELMRKYPADENDLLFRDATLYEQQGRWQDCYETLRRYRVSARLPNMASEVMLVNCLMNMNMGAAAMQVARKAREAFPDSGRMREIAAAIWAHFGFNEEAMFSLDQPGVDLNPGLVAQVLFDSSRYVEADKVARGMGVDLKRDKRPRAQQYVPPPAELSVARRWPEPLTEDELKELAGESMNRATQATSPFLRALSGLETEWQRNEGKGKWSAIALWESAGRDTIEKAVALNRLAMLQARQRQFDAATATAEKTCALAPDSAVYWWILIGLKEGDRAAVTEARKNCPDDAEIWLADIVSRFRAEGKGTWLSGEIDRVTAGDVYPIGTLTRAGNYLVRQNALAEASRLARYVAHDRAKGYLPAHVLALHCALVNRDAKWALSAALKCVDNAIDPGNFYQTIVEIKSSGQTMDADLVAALEFLQGKYPKDPKWVEKLGYIYLLKGDSKRAENILEPLLEGGSAVSIRALNMAAEAARSQGNIQKSLRTLETAHTLYPDDGTVLNNLIYNLAQDHETADRALKLIPELLKTHSEHYEVLDTAAVVYLRNGRLDEADAYMQKALARIPSSSTSYAPVETRLNAAEIYIRKGEFDQAGRMLDTIDGIPNKPPFLENSVRELRHQLELRTNKQ